MKKKKFILKFENALSNKLLENFLDAMVDIISGFCSVEYIVQENNQLKNKNIREGKGLNPWL